MKRVVEQLVICVDNINWSIQPKGNFTKLPKKMFYRFVRPIIATYMNSSDWSKEYDPIMSISWCGLPWSRTIIIDISPDECDPWKYKWKDSNMLIKERSYQQYVSYHNYMDKLMADIEE